MKLNLNDPIELIEARKASPDWHGISVLTSLISFGALTAEGERDTARIKAMSPLPIHYSRPHPYPLFPQATR